jgi:Condensation domain
MNNNSTLLKSEEIGQDFLDRFLLPYKVDCRYLKAAQFYPSALQSLIDRHPTLRTTYGQEEDANPFQEIYATQSLDFEQIDAACWDEETLTIQSIAVYQRPFDIENVSVLRVTLLTQAPQKHVLIIAMHHIAVDGMSFGILIEDLKLLYQAEITGQPRCLPHLKYHYTDFVRSQQDLVNSSVGEKLWDYWQQKLANAPTILLPTDLPRPSIQRDGGASVSFKVTTEMTDRLRDLAKVEGVTLYILLLTVFQVLLHRYTGQEDLVVGSPTNGRTQTEFAQTVGFFVNIIALRSNLAGNPKFTQFLAQVRHTVLEAIAHQSYPAPLLIERLGMDRHQSLSGFFRASFNLLNLPKMANDLELSVSSNVSTSVEWGNLVLEPFVIPQQEGQNDLVLDVMEMNDHLVGTLRYRTDLFETATIERMATHFQNLLSAIVVIIFKSWAFNQKY